MISLNIVVVVGKNLKMRIVLPIISPPISVVPPKNVKNAGLSGMLRIIIGTEGRVIFALSVIVPPAVVTTILNVGVTSSPWSLNPQRRTESSPLILKQCNIVRGIRVKCTMLTL
ncbi:unnamed protein product [Meloidogyne enterolobii]|uniref:Uncharacterized protein n=1 Tax=Meloidogyne enterolobii TaxID=390850 RepID=A0ACB0XW44_MELEN